MELSAFPVSGSAPTLDLSSFEVSTPKLDLAAFEIPSLANKLDLSPLEGQASAPKLDLSAFGVPTPKLEFLPLEGPASAPKLDLSAFGVPTPKWELLPLEGPASAPKLDLSAFGIPTPKLEFSPFEGPASAPKLDLSAFGIPTPKLEFLPLEGAASARKLDLSAFGIPTPKLEFSQFEGPASAPKLKSEFDLQASDSPLDLPGFGVQAQDATKAIKSRATPTKSVTSGKKATRPIPAQFDVWGQLAKYEPIARPRPTHNYPIGLEDNPIVFSTPADKVLLTLSGRRVFSINHLKFSPFLVNHGRVLTTHIYDASELHVSAQDTTCQDQLKLTIADAMMRGELRKLDELPIIGEILIGPFNLDGAFYRVLVYRVHVKRKLVKIEFIDYGATCTAKFDDLYIPTDEIGNAPLNATNVKLCSITQGIPCPETIVKLLNEEPLIIHFYQEKVHYGQLVQMDVKESLLSLNHLMESEIKGLRDVTNLILVEHVQKEIDEHYEKWLQTVKSKGSYKPSSFDANGVKMVFFVALYATLSTKLLEYFLLPDLHFIYMLVDIFFWEFHDK